MTIAIRMVLLITLGALGLLAVGGFGLWQIRQIQVSVGEIQKDVLPSIQALAKAEKAFLQARAPLLRAMNAKNGEQRSKEAQAFESLFGQLRAGLSEYERLALDEKDRASLIKLKTFAQRYHEDAQRLLVLVREGQPDAVAQHVAQMMVTVDDMGSTFATHVSYNHGLALAHANAITALSDTAVKVIVAAVLVCVLACSGFGALMYRQVAGALQRLVDLVARVEGERDFTLRLAMSGKDEVAIVGRAFDRLLEGMQESLKGLADRSARVNEAAGRLAAVAAQMSAASAYQSESASSMAASIEEMSVSINHVAERASDTRQIADLSGAQARTGLEVIDRTVAGIDSIATTVHEAAGRIAQLNRPLNFPLTPPATEL